MILTLTTALGFIVLFAAAVIVQLGFALTLIVIATTVAALASLIVLFCCWVTGRRTA